MPTIAITGASSGLGAALARSYAKPHTVLALHGRDAARLEQTAATVRALGATALVHQGDVTDAADLKDWLSSLPQLDLVIANAGISGGTAGGSETAAQVERIFAVNLNGVINTVHAALPIFLRQGYGQISLMASLAGFRGLPSCPAYAASKAAVRSYGEGLRGELITQKIKVNVICPGYIETPMTAVNRFPMPFLMPADRAARIIQKGLARNQARIAFPWPLYSAVWLLNTMPPQWTDHLLARLPKKVSVPEL
jgi:short-subunit dehydrogenase